MKSRWLRWFVGAMVMLAGSYVLGALMMVGVGYLALQRQRRARTFYRGVS